jgi:hypothetical protein
MLRAKCSFTYPKPDGSQGYVRHGDVVGADHESVAGREALFVDLDPAPAVEDKPRPVRKAKA